MAGSERQNSSTLTASEITSIQPGGGFCMKLELAWGKLRRAWLRSFRPAYVRRVSEVRRGHCRDCPHDIIDARDLKLWRNVCGYSFAEKEDPFRGPNRLGLAKAGRAELYIFGSTLLSAIIVFAIASAMWHFLFVIPLLVAIVLLVFVVSFFRDPERKIPVDADALVSPADGTVTHVDEVDEPDFPGGRAFRISIFLSIFNVHVNRVPRNGRVTRIRYFPGEFLDARDKECAVRNEQLWLDLEEDGTHRPIRVKQISGAIARRIVCWVRSGEQVERGQRFGMIKFGSRTELLVPAGESLDVLVKVGDKVKGACTALARWR
jgi:phosphatidylserine decarboxylase